MTLIQTGGEPFLIRGNSGIGVLLLHGWTSYPQEMRDLGDYLSRSGHTVLGVRLPGHATRAADLNRLRWQDWMAAAEDGHSLLSSSCDRIVTIGQSLGGALALLLAAQRPVAGVVAMSTPYQFPSHAQLRFLRVLLYSLPVLSQVLRYIPKPRINDYKDQRAYEAHLSYPVFPVRSVLEVDGLLGSLRQRLPDLRAPVLLMHALEDRGVPPSNAESIFSLLGSQEKELVWVRSSGHVMTVEPARHWVYKNAAAFVDRVSEVVPL